MCHIVLPVVWSWCWCFVMHGRCRMMHSWLRHVTVSVEAIVLVVIAAPVGNEYLRVCVVEMTSVIVRVHCEDDDETFDVPPERL